MGARGFSPRGSKGGRTETTSASGRVTTKHTETLGSAGLYQAQVAPLRRLGRLDAAEPILQLLVQNRTNVPEVYRDLAELADQRGVASEAARWTNQWLALEPNRADQRWEMASKALSIGQEERAAVHLRRVLELDPLHSGALEQSARMMLREGVYDEALTLLQRLLDLQMEHNPETLAAAALSALEIGQFAEAASLAHDCLAHQKPSAWASVAVAVQARLLQRQGREAEAFQLAEQSLSDNSAAWPVPRILAPLLLEQQRLQTLKRVLLRARQNQPKAPDLQLVEAELHWLQGNLQAGFRSYQARQPKLHGCVLPNFELARGSSDPLVLVAEGTLGDTLLYSRYAPWLSEKLNREVCLAVQPPLLALLEDNLGSTVRVISYNGLYSIDKGEVMPLLSAPAHFGTCQEHPELAKPHLKANPRLVEYWNRTLAIKKGQRLIGVNWHGSALQALSERHRSDIPLEDLAALAELPDVKLVSLQKGIGSEQLHDCSFIGAFVDAQDVVSREHRLEYIAALMELCDWIVSDDSGPAHLAGCLGVPTAVLLPERVNWRWACHGQASPWYPHSHLLRQAGDQSWQALVRDACITLG